MAGPAMASSQRLPNAGRYLRRTFHPARSTRTSCRTSSWSFERLACLRVILGVRPHVGRRGQPVGHVVEGGDRGDVPDVAIFEADLAQPLPIAFLDQPWLRGKLYREIEHGALTLVQARGAIIHHHHFT